MRHNGIKFRVTDTTDATSPSTGAVGTSGGISAAKAIYAGTKITATTGFFYGANQVVEARQAAIADPAGGSTVDTEARAQLGLALAALRAHGLIET